MTSRTHSPAARVLAPVIVIILVAASALYVFPRKKEMHVKSSAHRQKPTAALVQLLAAKPLPVRDDFIAAASGLSEHLAKMDIKLIVALLPEREAVSQESSPNHPDGLPQTAWTRSGGLLAGAETRLNEARVSVCNLLPLLHDDFVRHPASPPFRDSAHLTHLGIASIGREFASWAGWRTDTKDASHAMWLGDCHTTHIRRFLEERGYGQPQVCWRNASANQMAHEASLLKASDFSGIREVVWMVQSEYLSDSIFPPVAAGSPSVAEGETSCVATIQKTSRLPKDLGPGSPYPDAVTVIEFAAADGATLMGLTYVMRNHVVDEAVRDQWLEGAHFRLKLISWESACGQTPELKNLRQIDDQTDFAAPRYWIAGWQRLD